MLVMELQIGPRDCIGIEQAVRAARGCAFIHAVEHRDATINHKVADMDVLRLQFAGETLRKATQSEFAHREGA